MIAILRRQDNKCMPGGIRIRLWRLGMQNREGKQVTIFGKEATPTQPPLCFSSSLETSKNRKFHINTKRASVNNQMNDTWPELRCERCWGLPYCDYISILLPALALLSLFSTSSNFCSVMCNYLAFIHHPHTHNQQVRHILPSLPSSLVPFCPSRWWRRWWWENMTPDLGRPHKKKLSEAKTKAQHKHTQTNFDIQIRLSVTQTLAYTHHNGLHRAEEEWAPAMQTLLYMETQQKKKLLTCGLIH